MKATRLPPTIFFRHSSSCTHSNKSIFNVSLCCSCCCTFFFLGACLGDFGACLFTVAFLLNDLILKSPGNLSWLLALEAKSSSESAAIILLLLLLCLEDVLSFKYYPFTCVAPMGIESGILFLWQRAPTPDALLKRLRLTLQTVFFTH